MARKTLYHLCCAVAVVGFFMRNLRPGILLQNLGLAGCFALVLIELAAAVGRKRFDSDEDAAAGTTNASQEFAGRPESKSRTNHFSWKVFWILYSLTIAV